MGTIRPALTNFALGELSPKLAGRVDLPLYTKGALEMTNVAPLPLGGCGKRGGLEWKLAIDEAAAGSCRMIPWSISNEIDILVLLFDGYIKFLNVSGGMNPAFIVGEEGVDLEITAMGPSQLVYSASDISQIRYAQSLNTLVMVHPLFPPFVIRASQAGYLTLSLSYQIAGVLGNVAITQYVEEDVVVQKDMGHRDIINELKKYVQGLDPSDTVTYSAPDIDGVVVIGTETRAITSIVVTRNTEYNRVFVGGNQYTETSPGTLSGEWAGACNIGTSIVYGTYHKNWFISWSDASLVGYAGTLAGTDTWTQVIQWALEKLRPGSPYIITAWGTAWTGPLSNSEMFYGIPQKSFSVYPKHDTYTVTIHYSGEVSPQVFTSSSTGSVAGYIKISSISMNLNGYAVALIDMIDRLAPWMVEGKAYPCDDRYRLNGGIPLRATKTVVNGEPKITVFMDGGRTQDLSRSDPAKMTGQIGVKLTPFGNAGEYPSVVAFHQGRCCMGGATSEPNVLYMSKVNDYFNFAYFEEIEYIQTAMKPKSEETDNDTPEYETKTSTIQQTGSSSAICLVIATDENEAIQSLVAQDDLFIGTSTSEWIFPAGLTALNPRVSLVSRYGSANLQARFIRDAIMFVGSSRKTVRAFGSPGADLMQYAEHIAKAGIISFDFRQEPYNELYLVLANGTAVVGRLGDEGVAWFRIATKEGDLIESVACIRASDEDAAYFIVKRIIGESTVRTIERLVTTDDTTFAGRIYLDSATLVPASSGFNATRLIGETVTIRGIRADGKEFSGTAVAASSVTQFTDDADGASRSIDAFTQLIFGLPYNSAIETMRLDAIETAGILKKAEAIFFRCYETGPFDLVVRHPAPFGDPTDTEDRFPITAPTYDGVTQFPYTGTIRYENMDPWSTEQTVRLESNGSTPLGIQLIIPQYQVGESL